jgi:surface protein
MKKISILMIAALAALMACRKEAQPQSDARSLAPAVLHAGFEAPAMTRAGFEYDADGKTYSHFWEVGDRLLWVDKYACPPGDQVSWVNRYDCTDANGTFTRDSHFFLTDDYRGTQSYNGDTQHNYAVYPYSDSYAAALEAFLSDPSNTQSAWYDDWGWDSFLLFGLNSLYINLPATETFAPTANTFGYGNVALAKVDDDFTDVTFRSCMGWLKLQLTGASPVRKVSVRGHVIDEDHPLVLSGRGYIEQINSDAPYVRMDTDDAWDFEDWQFTKTVEIESPYLALDPTTPTPFYIALPPTVFTNGLTVTVTFDSGVEKTLSTDRTIEIKRNVVTPMKSHVAALDATLAEGSAFNAALKTLAAGSAVTYTTADVKIKDIVLETLSPVTTGTVVSDPASEAAVYANFNAETGVMTLSTIAGTIYANSDASDMFRNFQGLTARPAIGLNTSRVTVFDDFFQMCTNLTALDLSDFDTSSAKSMYSMFHGCIRLSSLNLSGFTTSEVTTMASMFGSCTALNSLDLSGFDTGKVKSMDHMFSNCANLQTLTLGEGFVTTNVTKMGYMFYKCYYFTSWDISGFDYSKVMDTSYMFYDCFRMTTMDLSGKNAPVLADAKYMFGACTGLTTLKLPSTTSALKDVSYMFSNCTSLPSYFDASALEGRPTTVEGMFAGCTSLSTLVMSWDFDTSDCDNFKKLFKGDTSLWNVKFPGLIIKGVTGTGLDYYMTFYESLANVGGCLIFVQSRAATGSSSYSSAFGGTAASHYTGQPTTIEETSTTNWTIGSGTVRFTMNMTRD